MDEKKITKKNYINWSFSELVLISPEKTTTVKLVK